MRKILDEEIKRIETLNLTRHELPVVISIPHSGEYITENMQENLLENVILSNMDWYLPKLYSFLDDLGFTTIINNISRYVIDVNRNIDDNNDNSYKNMLIYNKTTFEKEMYKKQPDLNEVNDRIKNFYILYHQTINNAINEKLKYFDKVYLIDLHSFGKNVSADIVLGNDKGKTTTNYFIELIGELLEKEGFKIKNNTPYSGGYITKHYGNVIENCEALQIELCYQTYIDKREFVNEEFPNINEELFIDAQKKVKNFFINLKDELKRETKA